MNTKIHENLKSSAIYEKLCQLIPGGVNSPVRACKSVGQLPLVAASARNDQIVDVDGRAFIDFCMSWGPLIHGHAHPEIIEAIQMQLALGTTYGTTSALEEQLAEKVCSLMPSIEMVRFVSSGTEAAMSAVRLARGVTGRDCVVKFSGHYHGHADFFLVQAGSGVFHLPESSSKGIPSDIVKNTLCLPFNDVGAIQKLFQSPLAERIACVILEPIAGNIGVVPATQEFLEVLRKETERTQALLIFDEVITGFRVAKGGAQALYGIAPDLTCLGKIVGGGLPAAAFGGRKEIMEWLAPLGPVYQAGTLSGNPLAMAAGLRALQLLDVPGFYEDLQAKTDYLLNPIRQFFQENESDACIQAVGSMFTLFLGKRSVDCAEDAKACDAQSFAAFFRFLFSKGIYIPPLQQEAWFISTAHTEEHLDLSQKAIMEFFCNS
jgi:glutamate-1-semialdehyde 2,1-aminomutase